MLGCIHEELARVLLAGGFLCQTPHLTAEHKGVENLAEGGFIEIYNVNLVFGE